MPDYANVLISVLHRGAIACGVPKWGQCCCHLQGSCRYGVTTSSAFQLYIIQLKSWEEPGDRAEDEKVECDMKWEHILKYIQLAIMGRLRMDKLSLSLCRVFISKVIVTVTVHLRLWVASFS